ncbi:hypothetical protein [Methanoregula sp.]|uniref:hypothetical protein n=1 Tax=Methanoregula sp. TaxID=2052170 RepID=UPI002370DEFE|nr:hypothetical protein [Methanoregula sp.]MDD1685660.1 hypothetical protein [Methanoregula sp.]
MQTRAAICGAGLLLAIIFLFASLPYILLVIPVAIFFLGIVADPEETHAVWYGMLNVLGIFDCTLLTDEEKRNYAEKRHYFWFGEVGLAAVLAGIFAIPSGCFLLARAGITLAFIGAAICFLPLFVFLPRILQTAMKADTVSIIETFGKNEHVKKVFWALFSCLAGIVLAEVLDPVAAQQIVGIIAGTGV